MLFLSGTAEAFTSSQLRAGTFQTALLLFTEVVDDAPVGLRHGEPLAVPGADVDVHRAEVVVFLVSCQKHREQPISSGAAEPENPGSAAGASPGVRLPGTFMYSWTVFMPRMVWPTWLSRFPADTTLAKAGSLVSSCSCCFHLEER